MTSSPVCVTPSPKKLEFNFSQEYLNKIVDNIKNQNNIQQQLNTQNTDIYKTTIIYRITNTYRNIQNHKEYTELQKNKHITTKYTKS